VIYDPEAGVWTRAGSPDLANAGAAIMLYDGQVLVIGEAGQDNNGTTPTVLYDPATNTWRAGVPLPEARSGYTVTRLPNRLVLVAGGVTFQQDGHGGSSARPLASTFVFDPIANAWSAEKAMNVARTNAVAVSLTDGRVLVIGGDDPAGGNQGITTEVYDPRTGRWSLAGRLSPVRARFAAAALADGGALVTGGDSGFVQPHWLDTTERFTPGVAAPRTLFVEPANGSCATLNAIIVRGSGFTPGVLTRYTMRRDRDGQITGGNSQAGGQQITPEGSYFSTIPLDGCAPDEPIGSTFTVAVSEYYPDRTPTKGPEASATFTISARTLSLAPASGPCTTQAVLQGAGFPASQPLAFTTRQTSPPSGQAVQFATLTSDANGAFRLDIDMNLVSSGCRAGQPPPGGTVYTIFATTDVGKGNAGTLLAIAFFGITGDKVAPADNHAAIAAAPVTTQPAVLRPSYRAVLPDRPHLVLTGRGGPAWVRVTG
jgi:hypothetical protein